MIGTRTAATLLFCLVVGGLWVRSYANGDNFFIVFDDGCERVALLRGRVLVQHFRPETGNRGKFRRFSRVTQSVNEMAPQPWPETIEKYPRLGVRYINLPDPNPIYPALPSYWVVVVPLWSLYLLLSPWAVIWLTRRVNRIRRRRNHLCPVCAYDLTANTTGICPECASDALWAKARFPAR